MSAVAIFFVLLNALALVALPRRWAAVPFLIAACYMTLAQGISFGPFSFTAVRFLIAAGIVRLIIRNERVDGGLNGMDTIMIGWAGWGVFSSAFHQETVAGDPLTFRLGLIYNVLGTYFLFRVLIKDYSDVVRLIKIIGCVLLPVALEMIQEHIVRHNMFSIFGGVPSVPWIREGELRAQGPFAHPILAGTVGAVCLPFMVGLYRSNSRCAILGGFACVSMVITSGSSGPFMSLIFGIAALALWRWRHLTKQMRIGFVVSYIVLDLVMKAPAYFLIARMNLFGGSTGWHRARLIEMGIAHINEWWWAGTDYTRHWMPTGVSWSADHTDITNHYLQYGVLGGLPLMGLFIAAVVAGFRYVGQSLDALGDASWDQEFLTWSVGAALMTQVATCISVSYFDQSYVFLFLNLAVINSLRSAVFLQNTAVNELVGEHHTAEELPHEPGRGGLAGEALDGARKAEVELRFG